MLAELLLRLTSTAPPEIRRLGLLEDAVRLWSRATRRRRDWAAHEARCHAVVERAVAALDRRRTVVVLGSGLCRDVPVRKLTSLFERVVLVDAVHLWPVRLAFARVPNVVFVTRDVTGLARWLLGDADDRGDPLGDVREDSCVDLVISANLLSQITICPQDWLDEHPDRAARLPADLRANLPWCAVGWHLADLDAFRCPVCLLTDTDMKVVDRAGKVLETMNLVADISLPPPDDTWDWTVAPFGEIGRHVARIHRVHGYVRWPAGTTVGLPAPE
jgi:hypothetical protein